MPAPMSCRPGRRLVHMALTLLLALAAVLVMPGGTPTAHAATGSKKASAIRYALGQLGDPYVYGAAGPGSFDCSGLTQAAYRYAGVSIPRVSRDQYRQLPKVSRSSAQPGDLLFWGTDPGSWSSVYHVAIYLGDGMMLDAPRTGEVVQIKRVFTTDIMPYAARPAGVDSRSLLNILPGEVSDAVLVLQQRLRANGYSSVSKTGTYDTATYKAVRSLRLSLGLSDRGKVGTTVWGYLASHGTLRSTS